MIVKIVAIYVALCMIFIFRDKNSEIWDWYYAAITLFCKFIFFFAYFIKRELSQNEKIILIWLAAMQSISFIMVSLYYLTKQNWYIHPYTFLTELLLISFLGMVFRKRLGWKV